MKTAAVHKSLPIPLKPIIPIKQSRASHRAVFHVDYDTRTNEKRRETTLTNSKFTSLFRWKAGEVDDTL